MKRYSNITIALHWLTLFLLVAVYCAMEFRGIFPKGSSARGLMAFFHFSLGLTVFLTVFPRVIARLLSSRPPIEPPINPKLDLISKIVQFSLYVFMLAMPILGWLMVSAEGHIVSFWGLDLPPLLAKNKELGEILEDIHVTLGKTGYFIIGLHALAALAHHFYWKDNTLRRMWFGARE